MSSPQSLSMLAAMCAGVAGATAAWLVLRPPRRVGSRIRPYVQVARSRLGAGDADAAVLIAGGSARNPFIDVFAPIGQRLAGVLGRHRGQATCKPGCSSKEPARPRGRGLNPLGNAANGADRGQVASPSDGSVPMRPITGVAKWGRVG